MELKKNILTLKVSGTPQKIEGFLEFLKANNFYGIIAVSNVLPNQNDGLFHVFVDLLPSATLEV